MKNFSLLSFILLLNLSVVGQVSLAPTAVMLDKNGVGTLFVTNNSNEPQEITINFQFGYSFQDEKGLMTIIYDDTVRAKKHGLDKMVKAFPRSFNLPPKQQQLVRLQVRAPKDLPDGMYFTRLKVGSSGQAEEIGANSPNGISTQVNVRYEQVIAAFYKKGTVTTGIVIDNVESKLDSTFLSLNSSYRTTGNAPYIGKVKTKVLSPEGKILVEGSQTVAMYFEGKRKINFNLTEVPKPGRYQVIIEYETKRNDIPSDELLQAAPYTYKTYIQLP